MLIIDDFHVCKFDNAKIWTYWKKSSFQFNPPPPPPPTFLVKNFFFLDKKKKIIFIKKKLNKIIIY